MAQPPGAPSEAVKVSFFGDIGFGRVGAPELTEDGVLEVASLTDLLATKLKVILQRIEAKDYRDIAAMIRAKAGLDYGLAAARLLYFPTFQPSESLKALTLFSGGNLDQLSQADRRTLVTAVQGVRELPQVHRAATELSLYKQ